MAPPGNPKTSSTPSSSSERTTACEPVISVGGTMLFGPTTGPRPSTTEETEAATSLVLAASAVAGALLAISEGLIGDPLVIGFSFADLTFLAMCLPSSAYGRRPCALLQIKKPRRAGWLRWGLARDVVEPDGRLRHALDKDDHGYALHGFSFCHADISVNLRHQRLIIWAFESKSWTPRSP